MPFEIVRNDIANMQVDAIVSSADRVPVVTGGVDAVVHKKAGPKLLEARKEIGILHPGTAAVTPAYDLDALFVIHAVTPTWVDGMHGEADVLRQTYRRCLELAVKHNCESVAFPLLAAGNHGFSNSKALQIAVGVFSEFLMEHEMQIYLVVFSKDSVRLSEQLVHNVASYIDENYVNAHEREDRRLRFRREQELSEDMCSREAMPIGKASLSLDDFIRQKDAGFTETLLLRIQQSGKKNSYIYKKANISKQHFSKLINDPDAKPSKQTAIALALALELDLEGTRDLIGRAGYALTNSSTFDLIIQYFIEQKQYDVIEINIALYEFDQVLLGN